MDTQEQQVFSDVAQFVDNVQGIIRAVRELDNMSKAEDKLLVHELLDNFQEFLAQCVIDTEQMRDMAELITQLVNTNTV